MRVGIEKMAVYPASGVLNLEMLAVRRGYDLDNLKKNLMVQERSVNPLWEDAVTMAVNAAQLLLTDEEKKEIGLLIVGSETGVDQEKSISSWVQGWVGLPSDCRNFEIKSACYAGTAGLQMALSWLLAKRGVGRKALVVTTDQSFIGLGAPYEYVMGAGAVALLISDEPSILEIEPEKYGVYAHEVTDVIRPLPWVETGNSEESLFSYMEALEFAYDDYGQKLEGIRFGEYFDFNIYHVPFAGISYRAHKTLLQRDGYYDRQASWFHFTEKTGPSLVYPQRIGGTYAGSIFVAMASLVRYSETLQPKHRVGIFSYGSGSCAEFYSGLVGGRAQERVKGMNLDLLLEERYPLSIDEYEFLEQKRVEQFKSGDFAPEVDRFAQWYGQCYQGKKRLVLKGIEDYCRHYFWS